MMNKGRQGLKIAGLAGAAMAVAAVLAGCGAKATLGTPSTGGLNNYFAVGSYSDESGAGNEPDEWAVSMDDETNYFSAYDITLTETFSFNPMKGSFTTANGFDNLTALTGYARYATTATDTGPAGPAVEIPGEAALLVAAPVVFSQPAAYYPAFAVASNKCSALSVTGTGSGTGTGTSAATGSGAFQFLELPLYGGQYSGTQQPIYGSVQAASTANADGSVAWKFSNFSVTDFKGATTTQADETGLCANSPTAYGYIVDMYDRSADVAVSPSGFFDWWQATGTLGCGPNGCPSIGYAGFLAPASPMDTSKLVAGKYAGAELDVSGTSGSGSAISRPVAFGAATGTGTAMTGGVFPSDDTTQTPDSSISIDLGAQSATSNGFYPSVTVTIANTAAPLSGLAIAGSPGGHNAVFVAAPDGPGTLYFFLYQQ